MPMIGRRIITTSCMPPQMQGYKYMGDTLDANTLPDELNRALEIHRRNEQECRKLDKILRGDQDILRRQIGERTSNNKVVINYAIAFTRDIVGYTFGKPSQYVQRNTKYLKEVKLLNDFMADENKFLLDNQLANDQSSMGTSYMAIFPDAIMADAVPFELIYLSPFNAFVCYSAFNINRPVYGYIRGTMRIGGKTVYLHHVYTSNRRYLYKNAMRYSVKKEDLVSVEKHILGGIPVIERPNNQWRLGDWECAVSLFDSLNILGSDSLNDVEQTVSSYLALFGVKLDEDNIKSMRKHRIMWFEGAPGINQDAKFVTAQLDGQSAQLLRTYLEEALRVVVGVPDRKTRGGGGGDTGDAVKLRDGWADLEIVARNKETYTSMAERQMLRIALNILSPKYVPDEMSTVDIDIKFSRNKTDNLQTKVQSYSTLLATETITPVDALSIVDITTDEVELISRGEAYWGRKIRLEEAKNSIDTLGGNGRKEEPNGADTQ